MTIKHYLIIDDNEADAMLLKKLLDGFSFYHQVAAISSVEEALAVLTTQAVDIIFLDIQLANQSGFTLLKSGVTLPPVIIVSAYAEYALESYEIGKAADYLLKPFSVERLHIALTRALQLYNGANPAIDLHAAFLKMGRRIQRFDYTSIDYAEAYGVYSKVFEGEQMNVVNERLSALTKLLPSRYFMRVHKSYLININKITSYDKQNFWLGKNKIPIGISYRPRLLGLLALFDSPHESENWPSASASK